MKYGIIGLGYVGLPLAMEIVNSGNEVIGIDVNEELCQNLNNGKNHIKDVLQADLEKALENRMFMASPDWRLLKEVDVISICVPTPLNKIKDPDLSYVINSVKCLQPYLKEKVCIILESTTYPGTSEDLILPILESSSLKCGKDFYLCYSPERVDPGNKNFNTKNTPKVIGGITHECLKRGCAVYEDVFDELVPVSSTKAAELIKVYENTFRMINIGLANELCQICEKLEIDVWEVIQGASTKPFGFMPFTPGPGLGGHCIPLDPHYLTWQMKNYDFETRMILTASKINAEMPKFWVNRLQSKLNDIGEPLNNSKVLILGVAYKKDIDDLRESPALEIISLLKQHKANVVYHDPFVDKIQIDGHFIHEMMVSQNLDESLMAEIDAIMIVTDHDNINWKMLEKFNKIIVNTRGNRYDN